MTVHSLARNWWMMAVRGAFAIAFGIVVHVWPDATLATIVVVFGVYAILDGAWAVAAGVHASSRVLDAWPILLEGVVSIAVGLVALFQPFVSREIVWELAAWGVITGSLEIIMAASLPRSRPSYWLLMTGAASSIFLALLIVMLPHAGVALVARIITVYAQVFGILLVLAASDFARQRGTQLAASRPAR